MPVARSALLLLVVTSGLASPARGQTAGDPRASDGERATEARATADDAASGTGTTSPADEKAAVLALIEKGERELERGRYDSALESFSRASALLGKLVLYGSSAPDAWGDADRRVAAGAARAYLLLDQPYLARIEAARALNVDPRDASLQVVLGASHYREGHFTAAEPAFQEALRLDPSLAAAHAGMGLIDISANRLASAKERFARALQLDAQPRYIWHLARIALLERDYGRAAERLREYVKRASDLPRERAEELRERAAVYARLRDGKGSRFASRVTRGQLRFDVAKGDEVPLVPVRVNGREPVYFLFDTGAGDHVLDAGYAKEAGIELSDPTGRVETVLGSVQSRMGVLDAIDMNGIVVEKVPVSVADLEELGLQARGGYYVAGILNPSLLFREFLLRVDFYHRTIELQHYDAGGREYLRRRASLRRHSVPFRFNADGTGMLVEAELDGSSGHPLLLDTGASDVYLSARTGDVLGLNPLEVRIGLGDFRKTRLRAHFLRDLGTSGHAPGEREGVQYEGILGYPFFRDMRLVFDYYHGRLLIES